MKCWAADKLSQYVDELITEQEFIDINNHLKSCEDCSLVVDAFTNEQQFLKQTLKTPSLPDHFAALVLNELEPYEQKAIHKKKAPWKRILLSAAGLVLVVSLSATLNPAFAQWIGGLFSSGQVDEGLRLASEEGFVRSVNQEVTDNGIIFKIEDVVADSSRIAFSYQILNENRKVKDPRFDLHDGKNNIFATDQNGNRIDFSSMSWGNQDEYGLIEFSIRDQKAKEQMNFTFELAELAGKKGSWELEIPIDLRESLKATTTVALNDATTSQHGVNIVMKEVQFAPSSNEIMYETAFTKEEQAKLKENIQKLEEKYGDESVNTFTNYGSSLQYHIENEEGKAVYQHNTFFNNKGHPSDSGSLQGTGRQLDEIGHLAWNESFIPQKEEKKLTFVLDGIIKTEPSDFQVKIKPKKLKDHPVSFEYEGNFMTIKEAKKHTKFGLRKSLFPIEKETTFKIEMEGGKEAPASELGTWALMDDNGKSYFTFHSGSILDEKDKYGRYKTTQTITSYDIDDIPEELTLHLLSVTRYYDVKDKWKVPLH